MSEKTSTQLLLENLAAKLEARPGQWRRKKRPAPTVVLVDGQECVQIPLTKGMFAIVDMADAESVLKHNWCVEEHGLKENKLFYAMRVELVGPCGNKARRTLKLHQFLMPSELDVDHKNSNGLDCRRRNLRPATESQNMGNRRKQSSSSKFKGVTWNKRLSKWIAQIGQPGSRKHLGCFSEEREAAQRYNQAAKEKWGEFARLNTIP